MATIQEIADRAGVSRRTVDRVLNHRGIVKEETAAKVRKVVDELGYQPNVAARGLAARKKKYKIGFCSIVGRTCPIFEEIRNGARSKAEELKTYGVTVEFYTFNKDHPVTAEKLNEILINFDCDALAVAPGSVFGVEEMIQKAESMDIPIVFFNLDDDKYKRLCYVGCDYVKSGQLAAGLAALCTDDTAKIGIYTSHVSNTYSYEGRLRGFESELLKRYSGLSIIAKEYLDDSGEDYYKAGVELAGKYPDLDLIYLVNPGDYSICEVIGDIFREKKIKIITNDMLEMQMSMLREGIISATISQDPHQQGYLAVDLLFQYLAYGRTPEKDRYYTDLSIYIGQSTYSSEEQS